MEQQKTSTQFIALLAGLLIAPVQAFGFQSPGAELPLPRLFQNSPAKLGRDLSSVASDGGIPSLVFKNELDLGSNHEARIGSACHLRSAGHKGSLYNSVFTASNDVSVRANVPYEMTLISFEKESMKVQLQAQGAPKLLLECTHSNIQGWSVSDFEMQTDQQVKVKIPSLLASLRTKNTRPLEAASMTLATLKGYVMNGLFGSGLPGTAGVQLLLGANLKAYASETNASLMAGHKCKLVSQSDEALGDHYLKGSKFAFRETLMKKGKMELIFDNWTYSPHQVRVECKGDENSLKQLTVADVERDLNGTIQFYQK